jgi:murein DD-endopeptidase MepM/ murein hydrolase activator NlpD
MEEEKSTIESELQKNKDTFLARIRAMYMAGNDSPLAVLLGADDFGDYLYQTELLTTVTKYDNQVMDKMRKDIDRINALEANVEKEKQGILDLRKVVDVKRAELGDDMKALNKIIGKLENQQNKLEIDLKEYQKQIDNLEKKIQSATNQGKNENIQFSGGQFKWPCPGYYYMTSGYGMRWGKLHKGIDIAGSNIYGKPIVAAADGVVSLVDNNRGGYGYYVMVNHGNKNGNNYVTLYAHMSKQAARVGQKVKAGDIIGYVGSTGQSTGPHLHFEIRVNGTAKNPMNFFSSVG